MSSVESCKCEYLDDYIVKLTAAVLGLKTNHASHVCQSLAILFRFKKYKKVVGQLFFKTPLGLQIDNLPAYTITAPKEENSTKSTESMEGKSIDLDVKSTALFQHLIYGSKWPAKLALFKRDPITLYERNSSRLLFNLGTNGYKLGINAGVDALTRSSHSSGLGWICHSCRSPTTIVDKCIFCGASKSKSEKAQSKLDHHRREQARLARIEALRIEEERLKAVETARIEAIKAERIEKERLAAIEAERLEAERIEKERLDAIEAERLLHEIKQQQLFDEKLHANNIPAERKVIARGYYDDGLQPELIIPLMSGIIDEHTVIQFRNQEWIKQYDLDDPFIMMILEGKISMPSAKELNLMRSDYEILFSFTIESIEANTASTMNASHVIEPLNKLIGVFRDLGCSNVENAVLSTILGVHPYHVLQLSQSKSREKIVEMHSDLIDEILGLRVELAKASLRLKWSFWENIHQDKLSWVMGADKKWNTRARIGLGYIFQGLPNQFVKALMFQKNEENVQSVIDFWFAEWREQYSAEDYLIQAVLNQTISESMGSKLNQKRSNHELLVYNIIQNPNLYEWGMMLLDAGFDQHPEAVVSALKGGSPLLISELKGVNADPSDLPPSIDIEKIIPVLPSIEQRSATTKVSKAAKGIDVRSVAKSYTAEVLRLECERHGVDPYRRKLSPSGRKQFTTKVKMVSAILEIGGPPCDYEFCVMNHRLVR